MKLKPIEKQLKNIEEIIETISDETKKQEIRDLFQKLKNQKISVNLFAEKIKQYAIS